VPPFFGPDTDSTLQLAARGEVGEAFARLDACGADAGLVKLCKWCLAPAREDRPADAGEVTRAIADLRSRRAVAPSGVRRRRPRLIRPAPAGATW
jgi:hypothetical protein